MPTQAYETKHRYHEFEGTDVYKPESWWVNHADGTKSKNVKESELRNIFGDIFIELVKCVKK